MKNHYHILVHTPEGNLSRFMRHVNGVYTQRFNRKHKRDGPLFRGRYKSILIQADEYLTQVVKYIHRNPLKAKMVINLKDYKWSSHKIYLKGKCFEEWIDIDSVLTLFSGRRKEAIRKYNEFMGSQVSKEVNQFYSNKNQGSILGDNLFIDWVKDKHISRDRKADLEIREKRQIQGERRIETIQKEVCKRFKVNKSILCITKRGEENIPRLFAISLSRELSGLSFSEIAKRFDILSYKTIASSNFRLKEKIKKNKKLGKAYKDLKSLCSQEEI
tara:strand:- start:326 stop:1144 length:819 start_codon:yes stop_codon:yes gene_type:complete